MNIRVKATPDICPSESVEPANYTGIYAWIRALLNATDTALPDATLLPWADSAIRFLRNQWDCLPAYAALTATDQVAFDEAAGHIAAARIRRKSAKNSQSAGTGELTLLQMGDTKKEWAAGKPALPLEQTWLTAAYNALQQVSCVAAALTSLRAVSLFQAAGKRRAQEARGVNTHSVNPLFTVLADEWDYEWQHPLPWLYYGFGSEGATGEGFGV